MLEKRGYRKNLGDTTQGAERPYAKSQSTADI